MRTDVIVPLELEAGVVGALLLNPDRRHDLPAGFKAEHLTGLHRRLYLAIERLAESGTRIDGDGATTLVKAEAKLSDEEGLRVDTIVGLSAGAALASYAAKLMDRRQREQIRAAASSALEALSKGEATPDVSAALLGSVLDLDAGERQEVTSLKEASTQFMDDVEAIKSGKTKRIRTGFDDIDAKLYVRPGNLVVIAARPGEGKTTLGLQFAGSVAKSRRHVLAFSLEMTAAEWVAVNLAREAQMDSRAFFDEDTRVDWSKVMNAADSLIRGTDGFLHISDQHYSLGEILRIAEKYHRKLGLSLVLVDYLQLVEADLGRGANREQMVATVSRGLKKLAMRIKVPVVAMAQLNREIEKRGFPSKPKAQRGEQPEFIPAPPPKLSDLRESGAIEQDANAVCFIHNPYKDSPDPNQRARGPYDFIVAKQRMGPKNVAVRLWADFERSRFKPFRDSAGAYFMQEDD